ncbi:MAG: gliding motility-associated C-terminal domain-containing protein [Crocinitomicaceae bacterium]|nr:gliding motility-associated C-terminal domain-containing protein [Crocinitomicaceae bacterium]
MKKFLSIFLLSTIFIGFAGAQSPTQSVMLGDSAIICTGQSVQITNGNSGPGSPAPGSMALQNPGTLSLSDDSFSGVIPIGFSFSFYGNTYSNLVIGSNCIVSFNTSNANGYCAWSLSSNTIPTSATTLNSIMLAYQDILPSINGGNIQYETIGVAPNRKFVVLYHNVYFYSCTSVCNYLGLVLMEGSNEVELHIGNKPICSAFNGGLAIQGILNASGSSSVITPGRNSTVWSANQDARRFTPTSPTNTSAYTLSQIPYNQISGVGGVTSWVNTANQSFPYNNGVLTVTNPPAGTTGYFISGTACGASLGAISDTTWITTSAVNGTIAKTPDFCSTSSGTATVTPTGQAPFTYLWSPSGQTTQTATGLPAGVQTLAITNGAGCVKSLSTIILNNTVTTSGTTTLVSCPGGSDGTATASVNPVQVGTTFDWFEDGGQTTATATGLSAGVHRCRIVSGSGCIDTLSVTISELPGMIATFTTTDVTCNSGNDGIGNISVTQGTAPYTYAWNQSTSTVSQATDLIAGPHTVVITDANMCTISTTLNLGQPEPLKMISITPDLVICAEDSATITAMAAGGSIPSQYTYTWTQGGTVVGVGQSIKVKAPSSGTQFCVTVTEACGSPAADTCMKINFPVDLIPKITPDLAAKCQPAVFNFTNGTNNPSEIFSTRFSFGNGENDSIVPGNSDVSMEYPLPGSYNVNVLITSIHGCVYTASFPGVVTTIQKPNASFTTSANPATVFETTIQMQNNSSQGVVSWYWSSPGASPETSTQTNPVFTYPEGEEGTYPIQLIVVTAEGCIDTVDSFIHIVSDIIFYTPNAFTPDGNEYNQTWKVFAEGIDVYDFDLKIFNRWGEQIWETRNPAEGWDGTYNGEVLKEGTYVFVARVKDLYSDSYKTFKGHISLLR